MRELARSIGAEVASPSRVHDAFTNPRLPSWGLVELLVEVLARRVPGGPSTGEEVQRFHRLWDAAAENTPDAPAMSDKAVDDHNLVQDRTRFLGPDHPDTLDARYDAAHWRGHAGDAAGAAAALNNLVLDRIRVLGPDHTDTLEARYDAAHWRGHAGDAAGAAAALMDVVEDHKRILGPDHPDTLTSQASLSDWFAQAGYAAVAALRAPSKASDPGSV
ncbi:hypothetical protein AB0C70_38365 [Streptomyces sp. NPDC048564]|uniref:hypothetical protein n=1 Tax=Streptomyces sp. NPDC048564 TaxID=3155760 RepID=UPI0034343BA3